MTDLRWYMRRLSRLANSPYLSEQYLLKSSEICLKAMVKLAMLEKK